MMKSAMKRLPFQRPTEHYDERLYPIDEQLCKLLEQRKMLSNNNPGYPPFEAIEKWARDFHFYDEYLKSIFATLMHEDYFRPVIEPDVFRKHIPVLKSLEQDDAIYTVTSIRQYANASVVLFTIDWDIPNNCESAHPDPMPLFELDLGEPYDCRMDTGNSSSGHACYRYVVSPPLPDHNKGLELRFTAIDKPLKKKSTSTMITIKVD